MRYFQTELFSSFLPSSYDGHVNLVMVMVVAAVVVVVVVVVAAATTMMRYSSPPISYLVTFRQSTSLHSNLSPFLPFVYHRMWAFFSLNRRPKWHLLTEIAINLRGYITLIVRPLSRQWPVSVSRGTHCRECIISIRCILWRYPVPYSGVTLRLLAPPCIQ